MLYYDRTDVSEGKGVNKTSASKECDICHYCYFLDNRFKFQTNICNGCHDLLTMSINLSNISISNIRGVDYRCNVNGISKIGTVNLLQNADLTKKKSIIIIIIIIKSKYAI